MKILIIDNTLDRDSWVPWRFGARSRASKPSRAAHAARRAPERDLPQRSDDGWDRVILTGSRASCSAQDQWVLDEMAWIQKAVRAGIPLLGVCFGHQLLARAFDGDASVGRAALPEVGWTEISQTHANPLLTGLSQNFYSFSSHVEEVNREKLSSFDIFARSKRCSVQGIQLRGRRAWGIQFHPEKTWQEAENTIAIHRKRGFKNFLEPSAGKKRYNPAVAEHLFGNFLLKGAEI